MPGSQQSRSRTDAPSSRPTQISPAFEVYVGSCLDSVDRRSRIVRGLAPQWIVCVAPQSAPRLKSISARCRDLARRYDRSAQSVLLSVESVSPLLSFGRPEGPRDATRILNSRFYRVDGVDGRRCLWNRANRIA